MNFVMLRLSLIEDAVMSLTDWPDSIDLRPLDHPSSGLRGLFYDLAELLSLGVFVAGLCCVAKALAS